MDPFWIRYSNRTLFNKGRGPYSFMLEDLPDLVKKGDANWLGWYGADKTQWPFNTACCADLTNYQMATCAPEKVSQPSPACVAAVKVSCPDGTVDCKGCITGAWSAGKLTTDCRAFTGTSPGVLESWMCASKDMATGLSLNRARTSDGRTLH